jgi:hypothetical protein
MSFWKRFLHPAPTPVPDQPLSPSLTLEGWNEQAILAPGPRIWTDELGNIVTLTELDDRPDDVPELANASEARQYCRGFAESRGAGLIEASVLERPAGRSLAFIYKRREGPAYIYTGMVMAPNGRGWDVWTIVAGERGTTGVREAVVTAELMQSGQMTLEQFKTSWARDPYDPDYAGVDRSVLRFVSDADVHDARFPDHPLSVVRRVITSLVAA